MRKNEGLEIEPLKSIATRISDVVLIRSNGKQAEGS